MRWCAPGFETALETLLDRLDAATWPGPPEGFTHLTPPRPMRVVLEGRLDGPTRQTRVVVKWSRPDTIADRVSRRVRGGKGVREGRVLQGLRKASVRVPEVLAYTDVDHDVVITAFEEGLRPLPPGDLATSTEIDAVATLLALAHGAGLRHGDLHAGNIALQGATPVLVDLGGARLGPVLTDVERRVALAELAHGLLGETRRSQRFRALIAYLHCLHGRDGRTEAREVAPKIEDALLGVRRRYRRGRDRRATRSGKHFELFTTATGIKGVLHTDVADHAWIEPAADWLTDWPDDAEPLKAGGDVVVIEDVVVKRYAGVASGRLPRPVRAFRMAYALRNRGIAAPTPYLALADDTGAGLYVAGYVPAPNLHDFIADGSLGALEKPARHRLLERLGRTIRLMHDAEVTHRDLKAPNLLVRPDHTFVLADLDGARVRRGAVRWPRRVRDMMRLDASLDLNEQQRTRILSSYFDVLPRPPEALETFAGAVAVLSRRKRGPSGAPR